MHDLTLGLPTATLPKLATRQPDSHKGSYGHALLIGGSRGMAGSISLTASAALHTGAGLVTQAIPDRILETVAVLNPCAMCLPLLDDAQGRIVSGAYAQVAERFHKTDCIACGPGLGRSPELQDFTCRLVREAPLPCVIDADALNNLADAGGWPVSAPLSSQVTSQVSLPGPRILTPHPGEWERLSGVVARDTESQRQAAIEFARRHGVVVVLKGYRTLVTDGERAYINQTGSPAMATGGSGDVLTGIIAALVCQRLAPLAAAVLGVYCHGLAAERSPRTHVVLPTDLIANIGGVLAEWGHD
jgi:NAD(P)H-hydrate epimerase